MLTKRARQTIVPAVPGQPFVAPYEICYPDTPSGGTPGHWETRCEMRELLIGFVLNESGVYEPVYIVAGPFCVTEWIPDDGGFGVGT